MQIRNAKIYVTTGSTKLLSRILIFPQRILNPFSERRWQKPEFGKFQNVVQHVGDPGVNYARDIFQNVIYVLVLFSIIWQKDMTSSFELQFWEFRTLFKICKRLTKNCWDSSEGLDSTNQGHPCYVNLKIPIFQEVGQNCIPASYRHGESHSPKTLRFTPLSISWKREYSSPSMAHHSTTFSFCVHALHWRACLRLIT